MRFFREPIRKTFYGVSGRYLTVYTLIDVRWKKRVTICLHQFHRGDEDPDCHDHPFHFFSFVLSGGYREFTPDGKALRRGIWSLAYRPATFRHRVELLKAKCWTFIIKIDAGREWGFWQGEKFIPWKEYLKAKGLEPIEEFVSGTDAPRR